MSTLLENDTITITNTGEHDRFAHYFRKHDLDKAFLQGKEIKAICGKKDVPTRDFTKYPVCGTCKEIYQRLEE